MVTATQLRLRFQVEDLRARELRLKVRGNRCGAPALGYDPFENA